MGKYIFIKAHPGRYTPTLGYFQRKKEEGREGENVMEENFSCITNIKFLQRKRSKTSMPSSPKC